MYWYRAGTPGYTISSYHHFKANNYCNCNMNDTTLPIPTNNSTTSNNQSGQKPPQRKKVGIRKGFALYDWKLLLRSANDLAQRKGKPLRHDITLEEVALHNKKHDGWIVLHGIVYNISPYLAYHPGGSEILEEESLGCDASALFDQYHRWVNIPSLIGPLQIGYLSPDAPSSPKNGKHHHSKVDGFTTTPDGHMQISQFSIPAPRPPSNTNIPNLLYSMKSSSTMEDENGNESQQQKE